MTGLGKKKTAKRVVWKYFAFKADEHQKQKVTSKPIRDNCQEKVK